MAFKYDAGCVAECECTINAVSADVFVVTKQTNCFKMQNRTFSILRQTIQVNHNTNNEVTYCRCCWRHLRMPAV